MKTAVKTQAPPSMTAFGWFSAIYTSAFALAIGGLGYLVIASWVKS